MARRETPLAVRRRMGRPPKDPFETIDHDPVPDSRGRVRKVPVTAADRIVETLRANGFIHDAAARAGIATETLRAWRTKGVRTQADLLNGRTQPGDLDAHTAACVELARRMERAEADAKVELTEVINAAARGDLVQIRRVETADPESGEILTVRIETVSLPRDVRAAQWLLSHRYSEYRGHIEVSGPGGGPLKVDINPKEQLTEALERAADRLGVDVSGNGAST